MEERKVLGKISAATYGRGGYQDAMVGLSLTFSGGGWGAVSTFIGAWPNRTEPKEIECRADCVDQVWRILKEAKVMSVGALVGCPVEVKFDGNLLNTWRVLKEVL